jgi:hypothetical protein
MTNPAWTPSPNEPDPAANAARAPAPPPSEEAAEAAETERVRQGRVILRTRTERIIFATGLAVPVIVLVVLWLTRVL